MSVRVMAKTTRGTKRPLEVDSRLSDVEEAISSTALPVDCRSMLQALVFGCLSTPANQRQKIQEMAVSMIDDALTAQQASLRQVVADEVAKVADVEASRAALDAKASTAESAQNVCSETLEARKKILEANSKEMLEAKRSVTEAQEALRLGDTSLKEAVAEKDALESSLKDHFEPLKDGSWGEDTASAKVHISKLVPLVKRAKLDESLVQALPSSCRKRPDERGPFDKMVLQQLEVLLGEKVQQLTTDIEAAGPKAAERAAALEAAQRRCDRAREAQQQAAADAGAAQAALREQAAAVDEAKAAVDAFKPEYERATEVLRQKQTILEEFESTGLASFTSIRDELHVAVGGQ